MGELPREETAELWERLLWNTGHFSLVPSVRKAMDLPAAPASAGLYRMTWVGLEEWSVLSAGTLHVGASQKIEDPQLIMANLRPPVLLTIGRTTNIRERLRQHFSVNPNHNRVGKRLGSLLSDLDFAEVCTLAARNIVVDWVEIESWVARCLLEAYGKAVFKPILDLDAEH